MLVTQDPEADINLVKNLVKSARLYTFECRDCGEWHIEEGDAVVGRLADLERFRQLSHVGGDAAGSA